MDDNETNDLSEILGTIWSRRWFVVPIFVLSTLIFGAAAFLKTPIYRASTVLVAAGSDLSTLNNSIGSSLGSLGNLAAIAGVNVGGASTLTEESLAILESRSFTESFIRDKNLLPLFFDDKWDSSLKRWTVGKAREPTLAQGVKYFNRNVRSVIQNKKTGMITLTVDWRDPVKAAQWANEIVQRLNGEMRSRAKAKADASLEFLQQELAATMVLETRDSINRLIEGQIRQRMLANVSQEYAFRVVDTAMVPDATDIERPKKMLLIAVGGLIGLSIGILTALALGRKRNG